MNGHSPTYEREVLCRDIFRLKEEKSAVILAHNYQRQEIQEIADFVGDSLELARHGARQTGIRTVVLCGVRFMAETAKILRPDCTVLLPEPDAGCPLADAVTPEEVAAARREHPGAWVISYVNTTAAVKAVSDVCCTSSNAAKVVAGVPADRVVFLPDRNLCWHVRQMVPDKHIVCWDGSCRVHRLFTVEDVRRVREKFPEAEVVVHPECDPEVQQAADAVRSTSGMVHYAKESAARVIIIGTEEGLLVRLRAEVPDKQFYSLGSARVCSRMKMTTLEKVAHALRTGQEEIVLPPEIIEKARAAVERMLAYG